MRKTVLILCLLFISSLVFAEEWTVEKDIEGQLLTFNCYTVDTLEEVSEIVKSTVSDYYYKYFDMETVKTRFFSLDFYEKNTPYLYKKLAENKGIILNKISNSQYLFITTYLGEGDWIYVLYKQVNDKLYVSFFESGGGDWYYKNVFEGLESSFERMNGIKK